MVFIFNLPTHILKVFLIGNSSKQSYLKVMVAKMKSVGISGFVDNIRLSDSITKEKKRRETILDYHHVFKLSSGFQETSLKINIHRFALIRFTHFHLVLD